MKLPELKKRFTRKYVIRIIAGVLVVGMEKEILKYQAW